MELAIKSSLIQPLPNSINDKSMLAAIKSEMAMFEVSGVSGRILQLVYVYLQSIPPYICRGGAGFFRCWIAMHQNSFAS